MSDYRGRQSNPNRQKNSLLQICSEVFANTTLAHIEVTNMTTVGSLSREYFTARYGLPDYTLYHVKGGTNTAIMMCTDANTHVDEPVLAMTVMSGTKTKPDLNPTALVTKTVSDSGLLQGVLRHDSKPFYLALTNLTTAGPLYVQIFEKGNERPLNTVNIISAGETVVVDSQLVSGVHRELIATSQRNIVERVVGRTLTPEEDSRCRIDEDGNEGSGLVFKLCVIPTRQNEHTMVTKKSFWACMPYFLRHETSASPAATIRYEADGDYEEPDNPAASSRPYHAVLEYGNKVAANQGLPVNIDVLWHLAFNKTRLLISILPDLPIRPQTTTLPMGQELKKQYHDNIQRSKLIIYPCKLCVITLSDRPDTVFAQCGHLCIYTGGTKNEEMCRAIDYKCPVCCANIVALIPRSHIGVV